MDQTEKRNLWIAVILSTLVFIGWHHFFDKPQPILTNQEQAAAATADVPLDIKKPQALLSRDVALAGDQRLTIDTPELQGSLSLKGARFDDLKLKNYHVTPSLESAQVDLLDPYGTKEAYYGQFGWIGDTAADALPNEDTMWQADQTQLTPTTPVTLHYQNDQGVIFQQVISVDEKYLFTVTQKVINSSQQTLPLQVYGAISRHGVPETQGFFILHEGPIGYLNQKLIEATYKDLSKKEQSLESTGGWLGITDKYWLTALIPDQTMLVKTSFRETGGQGQEHYQISFTTQPYSIKPGETYEKISHFFAGAKILNELDSYEQKLGIPHFDRAVDFGWFYFLTKPIFHLLTWTHQWLGNFGLAIMLLTVVLKVLFFPLASKSYRSMARMKTLQPQMEKLRARYSDDKLKMNQEVMQLYKREKVNPMAGCLPMLVQIPVFFALYKVLFVSIEMRHAPFYGWIHDLAAPDPTTIFNLFGLIPWTPPAFLMLGAWPIVMGITMFIQQKLNPPPADPMQAKVFLLMPIMFTYMLAAFPAGLVIYWTWNNILTIAQQWTIMRLAEKEKIQEIQQIKSRKKRL
ncbi:MAG: membrane protein insertase YidC [Janthinobacterium lividum]